MVSPGQVLIIDDDQGFVDIYQEMLSAMGLVVTVAKSAETVRAVLSKDGQQLDIVLLDQKLHGPGGADTGLDLLREINQLAPFAKIIVVTGYAAPDAIEQAFRLGAYDYLVKNGAFAALLTAKVRNALEVTSESRLASLTAVTEERVRAQLRQTWDQVLMESDRNRKGLLLEELVKLLFHATPGFDRVTTRLRNDTEEIDIVVQNRSNDFLWLKEKSPFLLCECKNWSKKCGAAEYRNFAQKLTTKYDRAVGFFFSVGGFTKDFLQARKDGKASAPNNLVIPADSDDIVGWIAADDRITFLNELYMRAVLDQSSKSSTKRNVSG